MITTTLEAPAHKAAIEALLDRAFGPGRQRKISYRFRRGVPRLAEASIVAFEGNALIGCARAWPISIGDPLIGEAGEGVLIGPVAVAETHRGFGLGATLVETCLAAARAQGIGTAVLVGDPAYYARFGFTLGALNAIAIPGENAARVQSLALLADRPQPTGIVTPWRSDRRLAA